MEVYLAVRRRALLIPGIKIFGIRPDLDMAALIGGKKLADQAFGTDHILVLRRADIVVRRDGKHLRSKHIRAVRFLIIAKQIQVEAGIPQNHRPV